MTDISWQTNSFTGEHYALVGKRRYRREAHYNRHQTTGALRRHGWMLSVQENGQRHQVRWAPTVWRIETYAREYEEANPQ
jgi:hypothetical protein